MNDLELEVIACHSVIFRRLLPIAKPLNEGGPGSEYQLRPGGGGRREARRP